MTEKLKELERHNDEMSREIKVLRKKQATRGKALAQLNKGSEYERKIKYLTDEIKASKGKIRDMEGSLEKKNSTAKNQFEQMLMMDHKFREMKGHYKRGDTDKLTSMFDIPVITKSKQINLPDPADEIAEAAEKLERQKDIELKRRKVMKHTFEKKIHDLQKQIDSLENDNADKDSELKDQMIKLNNIQRRLAIKKGEKKEYQNDSDDYQVSESRFKE